MASVQQFLPRNGLMPSIKGRKKLFRMIVAPYADLSIEAVLAAELLAQPLPAGR
jgi:hypothetical protein